MDHLSLYKRYQNIEFNNENDDLKIFKLDPQDYEIKNGKIDGKLSHSILQKYEFGDPKYKICCIQSGKGTGKSTNFFSYMKQ